MGWNRIGNDLDRLNVKFQLHSLELQNKLNRQQQTMNRQPQINITEVIGRMKKAKGKGSQGPRTEGWKSVFDLVDDEPEKAAAEEFLEESQEAANWGMEESEEDWISEESGEDIAQQPVEEIRTKKNKKVKPGKGRNKGEQNTAAKTEENSSGTAAAGKQRKAGSQTQYDPTGIRSGSVSTEELRQAMLWSEILGEPVSRRRRKKRMNG